MNANVEVMAEKADVSVGAAIGENPTIAALAARDRAKKVEGFLSAMGTTMTAFAVGDLQKAHRDLNLAKWALGQIVREDGK